jgi:hypothetical protein
MRKFKCGVGFAPALLAGLVLMGSVLAGTSHEAAAQVAAPSLVPFTFTTENPAAIQWGGPSRIGIGAGQQQVTASSGFTDNPNYTASGAGVRLVGERFSVSADTVRFDRVHKPATVPTGETDNSEDDNGAIAAKLGSHLALGLGHSVNEQQSAGAIQPTRIREITSQAGLSLRLGEWFFLGGSTGRDVVNYKDFATATNDFHTQRDVTKYGVGIRTGGAVLTHLEYYVVDKQKYADRTSPLLVAANFGSGHETSRTGVAEFNFRGLLLGYSTTHTELDTGGPTVDSDIADIGWAPYTGLTVVAHAQVSKFKSPSPAFTLTGSLYAVTVTYLFAK